MENQQVKLATFGAGCFWCVEACFKRVKGVSKVTSGYCGGHKENPAYEEVKSGVTGHAEVVQIEYDPTVTTYLTLLKAFFKAHDPTQLNRQNDEDVGTMYRSAIFYHDGEQKSQAEQLINALKGQQEFENDIVTTLEEMTKFWIAEDYHQNYYENNPKQDYCYRMVRVKYKKFLKNFELTNLTDGPGVNGEKFGDETE